MKLTTNQLRFIIKEELQHVLEEISSEEAKQFGPGIAMLANNPDKIYSIKEFPAFEGDPEPEQRQFLEREWIIKHVGPELGAGSFRDTYLIRDNPNYVLKISNRFMQDEPDDGQTEASVAEKTNQHEIEQFNKNTDYFPRVYIHDKEKPGIPRWLVVDRVEVIEDFRELIRQIDRSFKSIPESYELVDKLIRERFPSTPKEFPPASGDGYYIDPEQWSFTAFNAVGFNDKQRLKNIIKNLPIWDEKYGDVTKYSVDRIIDEEDKNLDKIVDQAWLLLTSDQYLIKFWQLVKDLDIDHNELREHNIGTDFKTRKKFLIIDISIFGSWT